MKSAKNVQECKSTRSMVDMVKNIVNNISDDLCRAVAIAAIAHDSQVDKVECDYICHPLYVMSHMKTKEEKIVAVLHDVVKNSDITVEDLSSCGFSYSVITALELLTRNKADSYEEYIENIKCSYLAAVVKVVDLEHNMDIRRLPRISNHDTKKLAKYQDAWATLKIFLG